ncbi:hypothetical protein [Pedosphaera parvula]|uniref:Uncharacterized protein n=1 Tax=Pedosphaera parvula (strain Ellin514) TaxID=320771 RepID=B9XKM1_PEDPL|nr:hypothetical protein [Pedosphaera parvula]EEF59691.1 hypothetical protein Cflav_PD2680 [Pedosphaera parvula Ellin514]
MKSIALFQSDAFDHSWPSENTDPNAVPLGRDAAEYLKTKLAEQNIAVQNPIQGEGGWVVDGDFQKILFSLFVHWAPIGTPPTDHWVIQSRLRRGLMKSIFSSSKFPEQLQPLITILNNALVRDSRINSLTWIDEAEFAAIY